MHGTVQRLNTLNNCVAPTSGCGHAMRASLLCKRQTTLAATWVLYQALLRSHAGAARLSALDCFHQGGLCNCQTCSIQWACAWTCEHHRCSAPHLGRLQWCLFLGLPHSNPTEHSMTLMCSRQVSLHPCCSVSLQIQVAAWTPLHGRTQQPRFTAAHPIRCVVTPTHLLCSSNGAVPPAPASESQPWCMRCRPCFLAAAILFTKAFCCCGGLELLAKLHLRSTPSAARAVTISCCAWSL